MINLVLVWLLCTLTVSVSVQPSIRGITSAAAELDGLLQEHAFEAFPGHRPKTGVAYDATIVSPNLTGVQVSVMRLKGGSLMTRGVSKYHEFEIPKGVVTHPYVERLALLYHNLANWSDPYYPPLHGYTYLAPVLGLLAYDASQLAPQNTTRLHIRASLRPISIHFSKLLPPTAAPTPPKCVFFDVNGSVILSDMSPGDICTTFQQGHFSVVVESNSIDTPPPPPKTSSKKVWTFVVVGVCVLLLVVLGLGLIGKYKQRKRKRLDRMEMAAEGSEDLYMTAIGTTKAPAATPTRTHPQLENDYVP